MRTSPSSLKIRQIVTQMRENKLIPRAEFQRRLVWTSEDKINFIDTILKNYPFPEVYVANGEVNVETGEGTQLLVDGQQRVTTILQYFQGDPSTYGTSLPSYSSLSKEEKENFLNYDVTVRDLGSISSNEIIEVFRRINATKYDLNDIEINNAVYAGQLMRFAQGFAEHDFFDSHKIFKSNDIKRMGDARFVLQVVITMLAGYFNRDEEFERFLSENNDHFEKQDEVASRLLNVFSYIDECGFLPKSRIWKKSDLFTALVEIDRMLTDKKNPDPSITLAELEKFYTKVENEGLESHEKSISVYAKAAIQASNDRLSRIRRGIIVSALLEGKDANQEIENI